MRFILKNANTLIYSWDYYTKQRKNISLSQLIEEESITLNTPSSKTCFRIKLNIINLKKLSTSNL